MSPKRHSPFLESLKIHPTCPHCSLFCQIPEWQTRCELRRSLQSVEGQVSFGPSLDSSELDVCEAADVFNRWSQAATNPLVTGFPRSASVCREAIALWRERGGTIDAWESDASFDLFQTIQHMGASLATFGEVRCQSANILLIGNDSVLDSFPMLLENLANLPGRGSEAKQKLLLLGDWSTRVIRKATELGFDVVAYATRLEEVADSIQHWVTQDGQSSFFDDASFRRPLALVWSGVCLMGLVRDRQHWIRKLVESAIENFPVEVHRRFPRILLLPIHPLEQTFHQCCTWLTGFPGRIRCQRLARIGENDSYEYDPYRYQAQRAFWGEEHDLLIWVDERPNANRIPQNGVRTVVLSPHPPQFCEGHPKGPCLYLPIPIPGIGSGMHACRGDGGSWVHVSASNADVARRTVTHWFRSASTRGQSSPGPTGTELRTE